MVKDQLESLPLERRKDVINQTIASAYAAFQRGDLNTARRLLEPLSDPNALHLLGLVEKREGRLDVAAALLDRASESLPDDADIANNLGNLYRELGDDTAAEAAFRKALEKRPGFVQAATGLGRLYIDAERYADADALYRELMPKESTRATVAYGAATAALGLGKSERAERLLDDAIRRHGDVPEMLFMRGRARAEQGRADALSDFEKSYSLKPSGFALKALASQLYMIGDNEGFRAVLHDAAAQHPELAALAANLLRESGDAEAAIDLLSGHEDNVDLLVTRSAAHIELEEAEQAESLSRRVLDRDPGNRVSSAYLITSLLMQGRYGEALDAVRTLREAEPERQHWIAYEATALRHLDPAAYRSLVRVDEHVMPFRLPVPEGYESVDAFNADFLELLERLHAYRNRPLDQSLRQGTQTPRDLMAVDAPVVRAFREALDQPIKSYLDAVGRADDHPLTARNEGSYQIRTCWSVRLTGRGFHVNHMHPEGWISSAYYVSVPDLPDDESHSGWIKFGEPPFPTDPPSPPEKWIRPEAGMLVLFPSFLWHGTAPIDDDAVRVTAPFDAIPG